MKKSLVGPLEAVKSIFNIFRNKSIDIICLTRKQKNLVFKYLNLGVGNLVEIQNASIQRSKCDTVFGKKSSFISTKFLESCKVKQKYKSKLIIGNNEYKSFQEI